jgi:hypothetical protein
MFESGALSKNLDESKVCPILFDVEPSEIKGPLVQFQAAPFEENEIRRVVRMINAELGEAALSDEVLEKVFQKWWPDLEIRVRKILAQPATTSGHSPRGDRDILEEVLALTRSIAQNSALSEGKSRARESAKRLLDPHPWPRLLNLALRLLDAAEQEIGKVDVSGAELVTRLQQMTRSLGFEHHKDLQVSVVDNERRFIYHDWEHMLRQRACHYSSDNEDIYDEVFSHSSGVVGWFDVTSNTSPDPRDAYPRFNFAVFRTIGDSGWRIIVEMHEELS